MSNIPEGATHTFTTAGGVGFRRKVGSRWEGYVDGDWAMLCSIAPESYVPIQAEPEWSDEGLPPVGTFCEFAGGTPCPYDPFDKDLKEGMKVEIIAHFNCGEFMLAAFTFNPENPDRGMVQIEQGNFGCFRPIRAAEQIAAEKRDAAIKEMQRLVGSCNTFPFAELYDYGYRLQVEK